MSPFLAARLINSWGSAGPAGGGRLLYLEGNAGSSQQVVARSGPLFKEPGSESTVSRWVEYNVIQQRIYRRELSWDTRHLAIVLGCCYYSARMTLRKSKKVIVHVK